MDERPASAAALEPPFELQTPRLRPLFLLNHFLAHLDLDGVLERHVPTSDPRNAMAHARALGVLLRSILVEREPISRRRPPRSSGCTH